MRHDCTCSDSLKASDSRGDLVDEGEFIMAWAAAPDSDMDLSTLGPFPAIMTAPRERVERSPQHQGRA